MARIVITGAAGFIGYHLAARLLDEGHAVLGVDDLNAFYPVRHKVRRRDRLLAHPRFTFAEGDLARPGWLDRAVDPAVDHVVHLAAYPGVLSSADHPEWYVRANLVGFAAVLELARRRKAPLTFASSSSVYGDQVPPLKASAPLAAPRSFYAATKVANEAMAQSYATQHGVATTAVRFFNVYGPLGRPDMAVYRFTEQIVQGRPVRLHGHGRMTRDLTYVDDAVEAVTRLMNRPPTGFRVVNVGRGEPLTVEGLITAVEQQLGRTAVRELVDQPDGEVTHSWADTSALEAETGFRPRTPIDEGLGRFVRWYVEAEGATPP